MERMAELLTALLGSIGFALLFGLRKKHLWLSSLGGLLSWGVYLLAEFLVPQSSPFLPCFLATVCAAFYVDFVAYRIKVPTLVLLLPSLIPLVPGSTLYYTFSFFYEKQWEEMFACAGRTFLFVFAIASGLSAEQIVKSLRKKRK